MENKIIDIGLGVSYPYLSAESIGRLNTVAPIQFEVKNPLFAVSATDLPRLNPGEEYVDLRDSANIPLYSGTLFTLHYPSVLTQKTKETFLGHRPLAHQADLDLNGEAGIICYWSLTHYPRYDSLKYRFVWCYRLDGSFTLLHSDHFAVANNEPWLHVKLDLTEHRAHIVLGDPILEPLPV